MIQGDSGYAKIMAMNLVATSNLLWLFPVDQHVLFQQKNKYIKKWRREKDLNKKEEENTYEF